MIVPKALLGGTQLPPSSRSALFDVTTINVSPDVLRRYLDDPSQPLAESERDELADANGGIRLVSRATEPWSAAEHLVEVCTASFECGARALLLPAALRIFGARQLARSFMEPTDVERWLALFVHHHTVTQGEYVWLHTHGMQHFGLPDVECVDVPQLAGRTHRAIRAVLHQLVVGPPLRLGDVIEHETAAARFQLVSSTSLDGHAFGAHGAVRLQHVI